MFSFLSLINSLVTTGLSFLLLSITAITSSKTIYVLRFLFGLYSSIFLYILSISEHSMKRLESFKCFKPALSLIVDILLHKAL